MPRKHRIDAAGCYFHAVARGNQKQTLFFDASDYVYYLEKWKSAALTYRVDILHYVLMPNHVHLLAMPRQDGSLGKAFHETQRAFALRFQRKHGTTGAVWQGRYWNSLIEDDRYLLACGRYIELNPVRAGLSNDPAEYPWSSLAAYLGKRPEPWIVRNPAFLALGPSDIERQERYQELLQEGFSENSAEPTLEWSFWARERIMADQVVPGPLFTPTAKTRSGRP